jgi:lysophospholipase L1-like esterase
MRIIAPRTVVAAAALAAAAFLPLHAAGPDHWTPTWATAVVVRPVATNAPAAPAGNPNAPRPVTPNNQTLRQIVHTSAGGNRVRLLLSNVFGTSPLQIGAAALSHSEGEAAIVSGTTRPLSFGGRASATIPPGAVLISDPIDIALRPASNVAVDLFLPGDLGNGPLTVHGSALQRNFVSKPGNFVGAQDFPVDAPAQNWFVLSRLEVATADDITTVVMFGDSITDGTASTPGTNHRWPDLFAERARAAKNARPLAIVNVAIAGNRLLSDSTPNFGVNALARFDRDVLAQPGATHVVIMEGINDIGNSPAGGAPTADDLIAAHKQLIDRAHARGLTVIGATLTPIGGARYFSDEHEAKRQAVNTWIRTSKAYDGVIDMDAAVRDPADPVKMVSQFDSGDHLHPSDAGYEAMAKAVDLSLFAPKRGR